MQIQIGQVTQYRKFYFDLIMYQCSAHSATNVKQDRKTSVAG